jgi:hypothetical protein
MHASSFALRGHQMQFQDEFSGHPDTEMLGIALKTKYEGHDIYAYPDPTGRSRKSSASTGITDFKILENMGITCLARSGSPPIIDSVAAVNKKLMTAAGDVAMYIHPRCTKLIQSMERTKWLDNNMDTATIDKTENMEHPSDGVRYATEYLYPIQNTFSRGKRGFAF